MKKYIYIWSFLFLLLVICFMFPIKEKVTSGSMVNMTPSVYLIDENDEWISHFTVNNPNLFSIGVIPGTYSVENLESTLYFDLYLEDTLYFHKIIKANEFDDVSTYFIDFKEIADSNKHHFTLKIGFEKQKNDEKISLFLNDSFDQDNWMEKYPGKSLIIYTKNTSENRILCWYIVVIFVISLFGFIIDWSEINDKIKKVSKRNR